VVVAEQAKDRRLTVTFKLSKQDIQRRSSYVEDLEKAWGELGHAIGTYNEAVAKLREPVDQAAAKYNEVLGEAKAFVEDIASQADSDFDEKSEKWQESDKGEAAGEYRDAWQNIELDELTLDWPDAFGIQDPDHVCELGELPVEANP
jgi:hypothetical protein